MSKIIKFVCVIAIIAALLISLRFVLTIEPIDLWLTDKLTDDSGVPHKLVYTEHYNDTYDLHEKDKPCICFYEEKLYMVVGDTPIDITPENINISYFAKITEFNDIIDYKRNCLVGEDGRYIVYTLYFKDVSYLYYLDIELKQFSFIAEKVDSFDIVENDKSDALTVIYATGYSHHNNLYMFTSNVSKVSEEVNTFTIGGESSLISDNITISGIFDSYGKIVYIKDGILFEYDVISRQKNNISTGVDNVYFPCDKQFNYDDYYDSFTVCASKGGKDYILNGVSEVEIKEGFYNVIPKYTFKEDNGTKYYYSDYNKQIVLIENGTEKVLYNEIGNIYAVFGHYVDEKTGSGYFIAASEDYLYLLQDNGKTAEKMFELSHEYKKNTAMLEKHMKVNRVSDDVFYVNHLTSGSLILNDKNTESWLSDKESYNYGLVVIKRNGNEFLSEEISVPSTRKMSEPTPVAVGDTADDKAGNLLYVSYFDDGTVKAVSLLNKNGGLVKSDILASAAFAKGQCDISVYPCKTGTYVLRENQNDGKEFLFLASGETSFEVVTNEKGIYTENYSEFSVAVSFGTLVIF